MKVAAIDIGTNSVHLLIAEILPDGHMEVVETARQQVELGQGSLGGRRLSAEAMERGLDALKSFREACDGHDVEDIYATATSAVREAENGRDFCKMVKEHTGIHVRVITGAEEARLIYLGARRDLDFSKGRALVFDLGGGSTEFILCDPEEALVRQSLPIGHIRMTDRLAHDGTLQTDAYRRLKTEIRGELVPLLQRVQPGDFRELVATSGGVRNLARIATLRRGDPTPEHAHGLVLDRSELDSLVRLFRQEEPGHWAELPGLDLRRLRTLPAAAVIVREIMKAFDIQRLVTSEKGLRDGLVVDWVLKHRPEISLAARTPDPRKRAVLAAMRHYRADVDHASFVARTAITLFDATTAVHGLRIDDRRLLEFAAQLHDIGHHIAGKDHQKHSMYLVRHTRMPGFTAPEIEIMAQLVRYHRGKGPRSKHPFYQNLRSKDRRRVRILSGLLQLADAMDRGHEQNTIHIEAELVSPSKLAVRATTQDAPELERWSTVQRRQLLEKALDITVDVQFKQRPASG